MARGAVSGWIQCGAAFLAPRHPPVFDVKVLSVDSVSTCASGRIVDNSRARHPFIKYDSSTIRTCDRNVKFSLAPAPSVRKGKERSLMGRFVIIQWPSIDRETNLTDVSIGWSGWWGFRKPGKTRDQHALQHAPQMYQIDVVSPWRHVSALWGRPSNTHGFSGASANRPVYVRPAPSQRASAVRLQLRTKEQSRIPRDRRRTCRLR